METSGSSSAAALASLFETREIRLKQFFFCVLHHIHNWKTAWVFVARKCALSLAPLVYMCVNVVSVLILEREVRHLLLLSAKNSLQFCITSFFWYIIHAHTHARLNNFLIGFWCGKHVFRVCVSECGKRLNVMLHLVGRKTAGNWLSHAAALSAAMRLTVRPSCHALLGYRSVCKCVNVSVSYRQTVRVGKRCLTTWRRLLVFSKPRKWNQQWRGCDVMLGLSF